MFSRNGAVVFLDLGIDHIMNHFLMNTIKFASIDSKRRCNVVMQIAVTQMPKVNDADPSKLIPNQLIGLGDKGV